VLRPDGGAIEVQAGQPAVPLTPAVLATLGGMEPTQLLDGVVRFATGPPGGRGGPEGGGPGGREGPHDGPGGRWRGPPHPWGGPGGDRPPPPPPPGGGSPPRIVVEFKPLAAQQLARLARRTAIVGGIALPAFLGCAALLGYLVQQRNQLVRRLEHGRR